MSLKTETAKAKENKDNMKKVKATTDSTLVELGGEASTSLNDVPNKIRSLGTNLVNTSKEYTDSKIGDLNSLKTTKKDNIVNAINEIHEAGFSFKSETFERTLTHTNWQDNMYNLDTEFPSTTCDIEIELSGNATKEHAKAWGKLIPVPDPTNKNNIKALGEIPSIDIPIRIKKDLIGILHKGDPISWNDIIDKPALKSTDHKITLEAASWTGAEAPFNYAVTVPGMTADKNWEITNATDPIMTQEEKDAFGAASIVCGTQTTDTVNLIAYGEKPEIDINVLIIVRED